MLHEFTGAWPLRLSTAKHIHQQRKRHTMKHTLRLLAVGITTTALAVPVAMSTSHASSTTTKATAVSTSAKATTPAAVKVGKETAWYELNDTIQTCRKRSYSMDLRLTTSVERRRTRNGLNEQRVRYRFTVQKHHRISGARASITRIGGTTAISKNGKLRGAKKVSTFNEDGIGLLTGTGYQPLPNYPKKSHALYWVSTTWNVKPPFVWQDSFNVECHVAGTIPTF